MKVNTLETRMYLQTDRVLEILEKRFSEPVAKETFDELLEAEEEAVLVLQREASEEAWEGFLAVVEGMARDLAQELGKNGSNLPSSYVQALEVRMRFILKDYDLLFDSHMKRQLAQALDPLEQVATQIGPS